MRDFPRIFVVALSALLAGCSGAPVARAEAARARAEPLVVFLVRHGEKVDSGRDPELSAAGRQRAAELAATLRDAGIAHVHSSDFVRTRDTAAPVAARLGLEVALYDPRDLAGLAAALRERGGRHLVVGHSNTTPKLVELLGGDPGPAIDEAGEYDRLYVIAGGGDGRCSSTLLRYGRPFDG